jgi:hypothetical protein
MHVLENDDMTISWKAEAHSGHNASASGSLTAGGVRVTTSNVARHAL